MLNFIVSTETFIFSDRTHWLMTHDSLTHLTHKTSVLPIPSIQKCGTSKLRFLHRFFFFGFCFFSEKVKEELKKERRAKEEVRITCQSRYHLAITKGEIIATLRTSPFTSSFVIYRYSHPYILLLIGLWTSLAILRLQLFKSLLYQRSFPCILLLLWWWISFHVLRLYRGFT